MQNPSIEFALQEFPEFSKAELEEMLTKGIRGEARTKEGFTKQYIEYIKDNTRYSGEIANYRDEELGMYGDTFHLANLKKKENAIDPTNWKASLKTLLDKALTLGKNKDTLQQAQDLMDSMHLNNPLFFTSLNPNYPKIKEILNEYQDRLNTLIAQSPQDIKFIDTKGKEHTLSKETQEQWLQTFGLQNLEQSYIPKHSQEIQQALGGKEIKLTKGSLLKLVSQGREQYIPQIKEVLDNPEAIIRDSKNAFLFVKQIKDDDYFVNVSFDNGEYLVSISNGFKETNNLQNKLKNGGEIIYQSPNANSNLQTLLQTSRYSANTIDKEHSTTKNTNELEKPTTENYSVVLFSRDNATNEAQLFGNSEQLQVKSKEPTAKEAKNITFIDAKGKEREITKQVQEQWLETFSLKSLDEDFIPQFSDEVRQALNKAGITQDFHLKLGSLIKLDNKQREAFLPYIKPTIEYPDLILDDGKGILFIKEFVDSDKNRYFMSVAKDFNDEWIFSSHTRRELKDIQKKTDNSRIIYNNGFKGGEVAGASDILESGGTTTKPSDLQITYPANHSSGKNPKANSTTKQTTLETNALDDNKLKEFEKDIQERLERVKKDYSTSIYGTSYDSKGGYVRLLSDEEKHNILYGGYNEKLLDKYLELKNNNAPKDELNKVIKDILEQKEVFEKHEHFKNAQKESIKEEKIKEFDKEAYEKSLENKSENEIKKLYEEIFYKKDREDIDHIKEDILSNILYRVPKEAQGDFSVITKIVSLKERVSDRDHYDKNYLRQTREYLQTKLNIIPIKEFGTNYAEFYKDGKGAIQKLLAERQGQVAGAFYRQELGDIDLVWGDSNFGLKHILDKHGSEFKDIAKELDEIIQNGEVVKRQGRDEAYNIEYKGFKVGINKGFNKQGENKWVVTAFNDNIEKTAKTAPANDSTKGASLPLNSKEDSTTKNTNPTQNTPMIHTKEAIKQYLQGFSKHLSNQSKQQIPSVLKEIDSFTNANDIVQYTGAFKKEIQQFIPYLETKEKLEQVLQTPKLQRDPKENLEVSITRIDEKPSKIHLAFDEKGYIPYDTHIAEEFLKQPTTNKDTSTLIDTFIKGAYKKAQKDLSDTYLLDFTGSKIDFGEDITLLNGRELYYKDKQINNEYASPSVLINTAKKLKEGLSDSDLYLAHANKDNLANYHYPYNLLNEYLEDISLLSDWGLADLLVDKSIKQPFNQALDKAFKANGEPFGVLWNNEATKKNLEQNLADYGISINPKDFFVGKNAIDFLLDKQSGYIQSAFHKEGLGDIDLVWGDSNFGLKHILQERTKQWGEEKALRFISHLSENIQKGHIVEVEKGRIGIKTELTTIILDKKDGNNFVITAFRDSGNKKELESLNLIQSKALTSENAGTNAKESPITSLNQDEIIPQTTQEIIKQAKASGKSVAETKELLQKHKEKDSIQDNPQVSALQTKIQQTRQQIAESPNPDKEYLYQVLKPDEIIQLEKQYFNQAMPQEYKELIQDFPSLYEQSLANKLKTYVKDTDTIQEVTTNLLNDFKDKPFKDTAKHAELLLFNTLKDKAQELGFKELDINEPSFKVAFGKFQARLKKGDIQDLSEHIAINSLRKNRLRIQEELNIKPLKEFGTNYAEYYRDGFNAVRKLLAERQGQVAGAFHKEGLGDIDLVWGDSKKGLAHILERRMQDFIEKGFSKAEAEQKTLEFAKSLPDIIENGNIDKRIARAFLETQDSKAVIALDFNDKDNKWILTAYNKDDALNPAYSHQVKHNTNTSSETRASGDKEIIPQNANTINILKDMQDKGYIPNEIRGDTANLSAYSDEFNPLLTSSDEPLTKQKNTLPLNSKEDSSTKNTKYTIRELKTPSDEELKQITQAYTQDNELFKQRKEIIQSYSNKIEKTKSKKIKQRLEDEELEKLEQINRKIDDDYVLFLRKNGVDTKAMDIKRELEISERYAKPLFDLLEGFSDKELREYKVRYKNIDTYSDSYLDVGDKRFTEGKGLRISTLQNILLTKLNMSEYPKEIQYAYFDSPLFHHARWNKIETKPDSELIYLGGLSFDEMAMNRERKDLEYLFDIKPIKEFGTNYAEFYKDGKGAIQKLLSEAKDYETRKEAGSLTEDEVKQGAYKGQVAGAFHKEGLGDIDLVWGEVTDPKNHKGYGLAHILDKHPDLDPRLITEIIEKGNLTNQNNIRYRIEKDNYVIGLSAEYKGDKRNFIITAFEKNKDKRDTFTEHPFTSTSDNAVKNLDKKENAESLYTSSAITKGETLPLNSKEDSTTKNTKYTIRELKTPSDEELKQTTQEIIKQAKASGKSVAETKELLQKHKEKDSIQDNPLQSINSP